KLNAKVNGRQVVRGADAPASVYRLRDNAGRRPGGRRAADRDRDPGRAVTRPRDPMAPGGSAPRPDSGTLRVRSAHAAAGTASRGPGAKPCHRARCGQRQRLARRLHSTGLEMLIDGLISILRDLGLAIRSLRRTPGFALIAVLTLGLGICATTSAFSVLNEVFLRPLPFPDSGRMDRIYRATPQESRGAVS